MRWAEFQALPLPIWVLPVVVGLAEGRPAYADARNWRKASRKFEWNIPQTEQEREQPIDVSSSQPSLVSDPRHPDGSFFKVNIAGLSAGSSKDRYWKSNDQ
jgi:hypothetical protein